MAVALFRLTYPRKRGTTSTAQTVLLASNSKLSGQRCSEKTVGEEPRHQMIDHSISAAGSAETGYALTLAGILQHHADQWKCITSDIHELDLVKGYHLEFVRVPCQKLNNLN